METKKSERNSSRRDKSVNQAEKFGVEGTSVKKERSFVRQSYNHQHYMNNNVNNNNNNNNNQNNNYDNDGRNSKGLFRQRSFVGQFTGHLNPQVRDQQQRRKSAVPTTHRGKPAMEIYRPPTTVVRSAMRGPGIYENGDAMFNGKTNSMYHDQQKPGLNINAKEFVSVKPSLQHSKSSSSVPHQGRINGLQHSKSGGNLLRASHSMPDHPPNVGGSGGGDSPPRVHFSDDKENDPEPKVGMLPRPPSLPLGTPGSPIKRSKSLGAADMMRQQTLDTSTPTMPDLGPFSPDVLSNITKTLADPNSVSARQLMEVVRHIFTRLVEASRYAEPAARLCIAIVEKEKGETFLETLLNTCQEYFQERDRLLRNNPPTPYPGFVPSHPRWIAYMTFLNEMYTQLKRRHVQLMTRRMKNSDTAPGLLLLTLLAQCCHVCLREQSVNSLAETECLFFVMTGVGKDIEIELPHHMCRVMGAARDAFLTTVRVPAVRKTLLQLIEMHAAGWQLPAPAVMYYYPGSSGAK